MLRGFDQPRQHGVWVYLEYASDRSNTEAFSQGSHDVYDELGWHVLAMQRGAVGLLEILAARETLELAPRPTPRMAVGANIAASHPTIVGTRFLRQ